MPGNNIELKTISELLEMNFFVPAYQRGYRWTTPQVEDLLNDIDEFNPADDKWYCLQPLVVKKEEGDVWEVIDGQQRLTTIFLIVHYINAAWRGDEKEKEPNITYQTRKDSAEFLNKINALNGKVHIDETNIDFHHISNAYKIIYEWAAAKKKEATGRQASFDKDSFISKFLHKTKVIWYEIDRQQDSVLIFTRINMGKIELTNAELIKALYLNSSNFNNEDDKNIRLKQLEIATEWDNIEYVLQNDEFWLFLNNDENKKETRIEFLFDLIVGNDNTTNDKYHTFREYHKIFKPDSKNIQDNWKGIKRYFQTLQDWFEDRILYHKIGYLITFVKKDIIIYIKQLVEEAMKTEKDIFIEEIDKKIRNLLPRESLDELDYKQNPQEIKKVLLLHNIQTMLNNEQENSRFQFNRYKRDKWDIEHIHAIADEIPQTDRHQQDWLRESKEFIKDNELINAIDNYQTGGDFDSLFNRVLLNLRENEREEESNGLSNLVLLDAETNRTYKNAVYPVKRKTIIEKEKTGTFVPLCTKNVFMKYYSDNPQQMTFWGVTDKENYLRDITEVLNIYTRGK